MSGNGVSLEARTIWQFGSPRSGSSWLRNMVDEHPLVTSIDEPLIGEHLSPLLAGDPGYRAEDLDVESFTRRRVMSENPNRFFSEAFSDVWVPGLRRLIEERFSAHLERFAEGPEEETVIFVKEPNGSQSADVIMRAQPQARLLFLLRDGRDVVDSVLASMLPGSWGQLAHRSMRGILESERLESVVYFAHQWLWMTEVVEEAYAAHEGPKHVLRYEDLIAEPGRHMRELFDWLDLELGDAELAALVEQYAFERVPERGPRRFARSATPGAWRENLRLEEQQAVEEVIGPKLRELGYESPAAAVAPGAGVETGAEEPGGPGAPPPPPGKAAAIDFAVEELAIESFVSLEVGEAYGQYGFYAIDKPSVQRGALIDIRAKRPRPHLLSALELAAERPGMQVLDGSYSDPGIVDSLSEVDAVLLFDALLRLVDPDWDQVLELYAPVTSAFVIANSQWEGEATVRLIELGREQYVEAVPPLPGHDDLFDRLDDWHEAQDKPYRDSTNVWQWGITDADLEARMAAFGFSLARKWTLAVPPGANGFVNRAFVFSRSEARPNRSD